MATFVPTEYFALNGLTDLTGLAVPAGILNGAKVQPFNTNIVPTSKTVFADLTFNADANMVPQVVTWGNRYRRPDGSIAVDGSDQEWQLALIANADTFYGLALLDSGGANLLGTWLFDSPITLADTLDEFTTIPQFAFGLADYGELTVVH